MTENRRRETPNRRREAEMYRVEAIQNEMASAVRFLGGEGSAKHQNSKAARETGLTHTVIERLRWRKLKRIPADIADTVREAVDKHNEESLARAKHELFIAQQRNAVLLAQLEVRDPDFYGPEIARLRQSAERMGRNPDLQSGE